jgi:hypothetical protein
MIERIINTAMLVTLLERLRGGWREFLRLGPLRSGAASGRRLLATVHAGMGDRYQ